MPVREAPDRRGRPQRGSMRAPGARARRSRRSTAVLDAAGDGLGAALLLEGHAGMGKTRLHEAALDEARARGMRVLRAAGAELEQNVALGVAGQLLRTPSSRPRRRAARRDSLLARRTGARSARWPACEDSRAGCAGDRPVLSHGLFTLMATPPRPRPTLIAIDDLHWCDTASLEFILYLLHRLDELPVALVMTRRPGAGTERVRGARPDREPLRTCKSRLWRRSGPGRRRARARALGEPADRAVVEACRRGHRRQPVLSARAAARAARGARPAEPASSPGGRGRWRPTR